jgi:CubicO group peptidase (beta-lactamase class C family)
MSVFKSICFFLLLLMLGCTPQRRLDNRFQQRVQAYEDQLALLVLNHHIPGLSIGIASKGKVQHLKGFGQAKINQNVPMTEQTPIYIASLTKPIAATVMLKLVELGQIDLDWKIKDYYPDYLGSCERILGYFNEEMPELAFLLNEYAPQRDDILLRHHLTHTAEKVPGSQYKYNGFLYGMLSDVVEAATQQRLNMWVDSLFIRPLGLRHTACAYDDVAHAAVVAETAFPYRYDAQGATYVQTEQPDPELNAGSGLLCSAEDLLLFDIAWSQGRLLSQASKAQMLAPVLLADGSRSPYGMGWFVQPYRGKTLVWHYGWQPDAFSGLYLKVLEDDLSLVLLANSDGLSRPFGLDQGDVLRSDFARRFVEIMLP